MLKKISYLFCIFFILIFVSCNNIFLSGEKTNDISLNLPDDVATRLANRAGGGSAYTVKITFNGINKEPYVTSISKDKIKTTNFKFDKIPLRKPFTISVKIFDNGNAILSGKSDVVKIISMKTPSTVHIKLNFIELEYPVKIKTIKIKEKDYDIVQFGKWPQTKITQSVTVGKEVTKINGWECYLGSDSEYYAKVKATPSPGETNLYTENEYYYFKMEPIEWRVLTNNYNGKKLLFAEKVLGQCKYYDYKQESATRNDSGKIIYNNNYKYSEIRAFLNGYEYILPDGKYNSEYKENGFLQKAFSPAAIAAISLTEVNNTVESTFPTKETATDNPYICENTKDKIFPLSKYEVTNKEYGFDSVVGNKDYRKQKKTTDFAIATGSGVSDGSQMSNPIVEGTTGFWLRSPAKVNGGNHSLYVNFEGQTYSEYTANYSIFGFVPALAIAF